MTRKLISFVFILICASVVSTACGRFFSPTGPSRDNAQNTPPPGAVVHEVPLPGGRATFKWWIYSTTPERNSQLTVGQRWVITIQCSAPDGYHYFFKGQFTNGPGTGQISSTAGLFGDTNGCSGNSKTIGGNVTSSTPDLPYYRSLVWVEAGMLPRGVGADTPTRDPDFVFEEHLGWRKPG